MNVQAKLLGLLLLIVVVFVGGLTALAFTERQKFQQIAADRAAERDRMFDEFLRERGDALKVLVEDSSIWDEMVRAIAKRDTAWAEKNFLEETLATHQVNAVWLYQPDRSLFFSRNNRYAENLAALPIPPEAFDALFASRHECHFFLQVPQGWMEIRGATVHPSRDRFRETPSQGYVFAGHIWITENVRRMSLFTGYSIRINPATATPQGSPAGEELGHIRFARTLAGWDGNPAAEIVVESDSPIIRELNRASRQLFNWLLLFAAAVLLIVTLSLSRWVHRPLRLISKGLESQDPSVSLAPLRDRGDEFGKLTKLILRFRDTEKQLERTEEELRHSQKLDAVGRLAGGVAHDFNNLLTAIIGYSELLERQLKPDGEEREFAGLIRRAGERAAELTRQLLAFSRKQLLQPRVLDLNALMLEMEKLLKRVIGEHIRISIEAGAEDARVLADPNQLEQVILNLGVNARDAMPRGGSLVMRTSNTTLDAAGAKLRGDGLAPGPYVSLSVTDSGSGMDAETKARIFEPFFTTKGPGRGTGLGLATVYGIVMQSHGGITVESAPGRGSTFTLDLPRVDAPVEPSVEPPPPGENSREGETVLVVEDEEVVRTLICAILSDAGYDIMCAGGPGEAIDCAGRSGRKIHLMVTDVVMPEMHGPALARALATAHPDMRVLYVSGYSENDISDQGVIGAGLKTLQKPFTGDVLLTKVREVLDERPADVPA